MRKNIKLKLLVYYLVAISIVLIISSSLTVYMFYTQNLKTIDAQLLVIAHDIDHGIEKRYKNNFKDGFYEANELNIKHLYIDVYDKTDKGFSLHTTNNKYNISIPNITLVSNEHFLFQTQSSSKDIRGVVLHSHILHNVYIVVSTTSYDKVNEPLKNLIYSILILGPMLFVTFLIVGYFVIKNSFNSITKVIDEVHAINPHETSLRINRFESDDEIGELVDTFNSLLGRVEDGFERIKRFSNDVSHELKTPLTVIRGEIELGLRKERENKEYKEILHTVLEETKSLQELIDGLLFLSNKSCEEMKQTFQQVAFDDIILDVMNEQRVSAKAKNIEFHLIGINNINLNGNELLLKIMVSNILSNAIKYSHTNSTIDIALYDDGLSIKDFGIGIKEDDLKKIFDRFYRADEARTRDGFGLGLAMVQNIVQIHNFKIDVKSEFGKFTEVTILF